MVSGSPWTSKCNCQFEKKKTDGHPRATVNLLILPDTRVRLSLSKGLFSPQPGLSHSGPPHPPQPPHPTGPHVSRVNYATTISDGILFLMSLARGPVLYQMPGYEQVPRRLQGVQRVEQMDVEFWRLCLRHALPRGSFIANSHDIYIRGCASSYKKINKYSGQDNKVGAGVSPNSGL